MENEGIKIYRTKRHEKSFWIEGCCGEIEIIIQNPKNWRNAKDKLKKLFKEIQEGRIEWE